MAPTSPCSPADLLDRLIDLTEAEQATEELETSLLSSSVPFNQLVLAGLALGGLVPAKVSLGMGGRTLVELTRTGAHHKEATFPPHGFRSGDSVTILGDGGAGKKGKGSSKGKVSENAEEEGLEGVVWKVQETRVVVALGQSREDDLEIPPTCRLLKLSNPSTYLRQTTALRLALRQLSSSPPPLASLLLGLRHPFPPTPLPHSFDFLDPSLNTSQQDAVRFVLERECGLIWGPPGTGKTQTVVEVIRQLVGQGERVLVCGGSNLSVDNVLLRLSLPLPSSSLPPIPLTRLGHPARILSALSCHTLDAQTSASDSSALVADIKSELEALEGRLRLTGKERVRGSERKKGWEEVRELRKDYRKREGGVVSEVVGKARVVLCTTHGAGSNVLKGQRFDTIIIDEAAQCAEPAAWVAIANQPTAHRLILAGDHLQLPPTVKSLDSRGSKTRDKQQGKSNSVDSVTPKPTNDIPVESATPVQTKETAPSQASNGASLDVAATTSSLIEPMSALSIAAVSPLPPAPSLPSASASTSTSLRPILPLTLSPTLETTLFSRLLGLLGPEIRRMLSISYRFNSKICAFPSKALYDGELESDASVQGRRLSGLLRKLRGENEEGDEEAESEEEEGNLGEEVVFIDTAGLAMYERAGGDATGGRQSFGAESKSNENEAQLCVEYVESLIKAGLPASMVTLLSPYNAQVTLLASMLHPRFPEIEVGSVDGMQGRENEVVIMSLVRSNEKGEVGFLSDKRRLNVAMTRARRQLVVVGDSETVSKGSDYLRSWMDWLEEEAWVQVPE